MVRAVKLAKVAEVCEAPLGVEGVTCERLAGGECLMRGELLDGE
jgi:hypothetical protein